MNQNILTTYSIVSIKYIENDQQFYLTNKSFIRDNVYLTNSKSSKNFQNTLFYVQTDSSQNQIKSAIEFGQKIVFRHKISNKYLSHSDDFQQEENDTTYKLKLSHKKHQFKIYPCFQYQTKISSKIRFNEDIYLVTQINGAKTGYLSSKKSSSPEIRDTILGINQHNSISTSKFSFHNFYEREKDEQTYTFGSIFWISHIQTTTFISCRTLRNKKQLTFQPIQYEKDLQSINGLWMIQSDKFSQGGKLSFQSKFRLKNLSNGAYMAFSGNFKMNENQRVYSIILEDQPTEKSQFVFKSLTGDDNQIKKNSYLILRHHESKLYIGCRKNNYFPDTEILKSISYSQFSDEDLYKIIQLSENQDEALRFVLCLRKELDGMDAGMNGELQAEKIEEDKEICLNIKKQLQKLKTYEKLFQKIQGEIGEYMPVLCEVLSKYRGKLKRDGSNFDSIIQIMKLIYEILIMICCQNRKNQEELSGYISYFVDDIFLGLGAESLLIEIFKKNYKVLCRASKPLTNFKNKNIIEATLEMVERFSKNKNNEYWIKIQKIMQFLFVLIYDGEDSIDINQRIVSQQFFNNKMFTKIFFGIKIINHRIKIEVEPDKFTEIDRVRNQILITVVEQVFKLFSFLSYHRNFISKKHIHQYLSQGSSNNIEVMIAYLSMPISQKLCNSLYLLITNLYIDSSPRIDREKPLGVVNFSLVSAPRSVQEEQHELSDRIKTTLLGKLEESYSSKPLMISNLLLEATKLSMEPTVTPDELAFYKEEINDKLQKQTYPVDLLKTILVLIRLESYSEAQIKHIFKTLKKKLKEGRRNFETITVIMQILLEIAVYTREVEMKKMTSYLKHKYRINQLTINYQKQYEYLLPFSKKLLPSVNYPKDINQSIASYNEQIDILDDLWPCADLKKMLLELFISEANQNNLEYLEQIYNCLVVEAFHKKLFAQLILGSIVVTTEEEETFNSLFETYKKLKHLTSISEYWLIGNDDNKQNVKSYVKYLIQVTNYLHQSYERGNQLSAREIKIQNDYTREIVKQADIYVNRQLLIRNIGFHKLVLELLESNYFLLETENSQKNIDTRKAQQIFSLCFQFIYGFIFNCRETKEIIHKAWNILDKFQNLPEVGQTRVYRELYKNKIEYIRQIKKTFIERIINKILKNPKSKSNQGCEFNPQYLRYLESIVKIDGVCHKSNLQKFYRLIEKEVNFKKILFGTEQSDGKVQMCLDMFQIRTDSVQVPFIYHIKILGLICDMADSLDSQSTIIKSKLRNVFSFNYLLRILAGSDIYSHTGLQAQMRFLLKKVVRRIVLYTIERNDSIHLLHENIELLNLVEFYYVIFIERPKKIKEEFLNQALYQPYFSQYTEEITHYENNERKYFQEEIVPFLNKISSVLKKSEKSVINQKINQILQEYDDKKMVEYFEFRKMGNNIDKVSLRWLNFVDKDENNSPQQKFAKLSIVDLLRSSITKKVLQDEKQEFNKLISGSTVQFIDVLIRLITMSMESQYKQNESHVKFSKIHHQLVLLRNILLTLPTKQKKQEQIVFLMERGVIQNFVNFTIISQFDFSKTIVRRIYHEIIKIFTFIISNCSDSKPLKEMYRCLSENPLCHRFWSHLSESILTISDDTKIERPLQQINWCLSNIYLNGEDRDQNIYEEALMFLQKLCDHSPFTKFLRYQPLYPSKDFLQILYHILNFVLINPDSTLNINVSTVQASQKILNCIQAMMLSRNEANQNYVVDSKLPQIVTEVLKLQKIKKDKNKADEAERQRLVEEVIEFYEKNGIDLSGDLRHQLSVLDFNHPYVLNRLKYVLLRTLMQSVAGNQRSINKLKFQIPIELIKINLIWIYQEFTSGQLEFNDQLVLKSLEAWQKVVDVKDLNGTFIMIGFYLYYLIDIFGEESESKNDEEDNAIEDKQKRKQKLVNKFFTTISEKDKKKEKLERIQREPFAEEMKMFFESYYESLEFFKQRTLTIEVNYLDELTKVYFPKLPICDKLDNEIMGQFKTDAVRISQEQKIKSLLQFEQESFDVFHGQQKFIKIVHSIVPAISIWFTICTEQRLRLTALVSCFIQTILFFIQNAQEPNFIFLDTFLIVPITTLEVIMGIIGIFNLIIATNMFFYLIFKKSPIVYSIASDKQKQRDEKERQKLFNGRKFFIVRNIFPQIFSTFLYTVLLLLSFLQPYFGAFILFDIMNRLTLGKQIFRSVKQTWFQLLMATILLIMFNYLFAIYIYIQFSVPYYSPACEVLFQCLLMLVDQSLKSGSGFYGTTPQMMTGYLNLQFDLGFISMLLYIIFAQKVMFEIFSGTIIDKFSQLREQAEAVEEDEQSTCYICGQERFVIDFQLEGFQTHIEKTHNSMNYLFYLYYLRKQDIRNYGIVDKFVSQSRQKQKKHWIPNETSILKEQKQKEKVKEDEQSEQMKMREYIDKKTKDIKQIRSKNAQIVAELKMDNSKNKQ